MVLRPMMKLPALTLALLLGAALAVCPNDCSGHGACNVYSMCECYRNYMGADCSQRVCKFGLAFVDTPQGDVNADGYISGEVYETQKSNTPEAGGWEVYPWYAGWGGVSYKFGQVDAYMDVAGSSRVRDADTALESTSGPPYADGAYDTTGVKSAGAAKTNGDEHRFAIAGASGVTRSGSAQGEAHLYKECSSKGTCDRSSGECQCFAGYEGPDCGRTACPNACSGHGVCALLGDLEDSTDTGAWGPKHSDAWYAAEGLDGTDYVGWDRWKTQACVCDAGFFGDDCSLRKCPKGDDPVTKYRAYTRIKLFDDTAATWYDKAACPTVAAAPATSTVEVDCTAATHTHNTGNDASEYKAVATVSSSPTRNADQTEFFLDFTCTVTREGVGYDSVFYPLPLGVNAKCLTPVTKTWHKDSHIDWEFDGDGNIPAGSAVTFHVRAQDADCKLDGIATNSLKVLFGPPGVASYGMDATQQASTVGGTAGTDFVAIGGVDANSPLEPLFGASLRGGSMKWTAQGLSRFMLDCTLEALNDACATTSACTGHEGAACAGSDGNGYCVSSTNTCTAETTGVSTMGVNANFAEQSIAVGNGFRRSLQGLLPTRVWTWETWGNPLYDAGYVWSAWYSLYDSGDAIWMPFRGMTEANCVHDDLISTSCKYNTVQYPDVDSRKESVAYQQVATLTGMASMASGTITDGCCADGSANCDKCGFFDVLLSDVTGSFNTGDELRVTWPRLSDGQLRERDGFALCNYIESISTYYAANPSNLQENEVQMLQVRFELTRCFAGYFALEFTDEMGDTWTTEAVSVSGDVDFSDYQGAAALNAGLAPTYATDLYDDDEAKGDVLAKRIADALEALPNNVVPDVDVTYVKPKASREKTDATEAGNTRHFKISFIENSGDIPTLGVSYSVATVKDGDEDCSKAFVNTNSQCAGYTPDFRFPQCTCTVDTNIALTAIDCYDLGYGMDFVPEVVWGKATTTTTPYDGAPTITDFPKIVDGRLAVPDGGLDISAGGDFEASVTYDLGDTLDVDAALTGKCHNAVNGVGMYFKVPDDYDFAPDIEGIQGADYFREKCVPFDSAVSVFASGLSTLTALSIDADADEAVGNGGAGRVQVLEADDLHHTAIAGTSTAVSDADARLLVKQGTTENDECSNRGLCDYATGTCKCFTGFTTEDCSVQNSLAMG